MSFNINDIKSMLSDYENEHRTDMDEKWAFTGNKASSERTKSLI